MKLVYSAGQDEDPRTVPLRNGAEVNVRSYLIYAFVPSVEDLRPALIASLIRGISSSLVYEIASRQRMATRIAVNAIHHVIRRKLKTTERLIDSSTPLLLRA